MGIKSNPQKSALAHIFAPITIGQWDSELEKIFNNPLGISNQPNLEEIRGGLMTAS